MGVGDEIMATGMARGAAARGKLIAFGDGRQLIWGPWCKEAFKNNPNISHRPDDPRNEWIDYYKGNRHYNSWDSDRRRWIWNYQFKARPGEFYFDMDELELVSPRAGHVLIEPNVPWHKPISVNKDWGLERYQALADKLTGAGWSVLQTSYGKRRLERVRTLQVQSFRQAVAFLKGIALAIVPEGGLHHACAAVGTPAIVIFGGCIPAAVLGYESQISLTGNADACGSTIRCDHCRAALDRIEVDHVYILADAELDKKNSAAPARAD